MRKSLLTFFAAAILISSSPAADLPSVEPTQTTESVITNGVVTTLALTEAQKAMIRAEEVYRAQVQQELDAKADETKSGSSRL